MGIPKLTDIMKTLALLLCVILFMRCHGFPFYRDRIPNGHKVPDPCSSASGQIWNGVGHDKAPGGGPRNQFGQDFKSYGSKWDLENLCKMDSDGDGRTNGEELGDPDCVWTSGDAPSAPIGHPGVCEPMNSRLCQEKNVNIVCP